MPINSKKKGNLWENKLSNWLYKHGFKCWKDGASGGGNREKGDIGNNLDMTIESKAGKNIALPEWWRQTEKSASIHGNEPVLFIHPDGMPDDEWLVVMHSNDWIEHIKASKAHIRVEPQNNRDLKWAMQALITALKKVLKLLEDDNS